jgi:ribosomal protein S18 acetylase RimI-like enzyme
MDFTLRPPRPDEAEILADLHLRTWEQTYAGVFAPSAWNDEARAGRVRQWTALCGTPQPGWRTAIADVDGRPVGIAHTEIDAGESPPRERVLAFIYLLVEAQGSGAGQALLDEVLGADPASLWVLEENPRARAFYARNGFTPTGERHPSGLGGHEIRLVR